MSTLLVTMSLDPDRLELVHRHLREDVVGWATKQPGFVHGHWYSSQDRARGFGVIVFDSEHAAADAAQGPRRYVRDESRAWNIESVDVLDVVAQA
jgi:hypothetical protein